MQYEELYQLMSYVADLHKANWAMSADGTCDVKILLDQLPQTDRVHLIREYLESIT